MRKTFSIILLLVNILYFLNSLVLAGINYFDKESNKIKLKIIQLSKTNDINIVIMPFKKDENVNAYEYVELINAFKNSLLKIQRVKLLDYNFYLSNKETIPNKNIYGINGSILKDDELKSLIITLDMISLIDGSIIENEIIEIEKKTSKKSKAIEPKLDYELEMLWFAESLFYVEKPEGIKSKCNTQSQLANLNIVFNNLLFANRLFLELSFFYSFHDLKNVEKWESSGIIIQENDLTYSRNRIYSIIGIDVIKNKLAPFLGLKFFYNKQVRSHFCEPISEVIIQLDNNNIIESINSQSICLGIKGDYNLQEYQSLFYKASGFYSLRVNAENDYYEGVTFVDISGYGADLLVGLDNKIFNFIKFKYGFEILFQQWKGSNWEKANENLLVKWPENYILSFSYFIGHSFNFTKDKFNNFSNANRIRNNYFIIGSIPILVGGIYTYLGIDNKQKGNETYDDYSNATDSISANTLGNKMQDYYDKSESAFNTSYNLYIVGANFMLNGLLIELLKNKVAGLDVSIKFQKDNFGINNNYRF